MSISTKTIDPPSFDTDKHKITILPVNYTEDKDHEYHASSLSFYKYAKDKIDIGYLNEPEVLFDQRAAEWFGPVILISSIALNHTPEIVSILNGIIVNYITDFVKGGNTPNSKASLKIIYKETDDEKYTELSYNGDVSGLAEINGAIQEISKKTNNGE